MALRDTIKTIAEDMGTLTALAVTVFSELDTNTREGFSDPAPTITTELNSLIASRKSIEKQIMSIKKKITDLVKTNIDTL